MLMSKLLKIFGSILFGLVTLNVVVSSVENYSKRRRQAQNESNNLEFDFLDGKSDPAPFQTLIVNHTAYGAKLKLLAKDCHFPEASESKIEGFDVLRCNNPYIGYFYLTASGDDRKKIKENELATMLLGEVVAIHPRIKWVVVRLLEIKS